MIREGEGVGCCKGLWIDKGSGCVGGEMVFR